MVGSLVHLPLFVQLFFYGKKIEKDTSLFDKKKKKREKRWKIAENDP